MRGWGGWGDGGSSERRYPASEVRGGNKRSYPMSRSGAVARRRYPKTLSPRPGAAVGRSYPMPEARVGGQEDQPHSVAALAQEVLEELSHIEGQEGRW